MVIVPVLALGFGTIVPALITRVPLLLKVTGLDELLRMAVLGSFIVSVFEELSVNEYAGATALVIIRSTEVLALENMMPLNGAWPKLAFPVGTTAGNQFAPVSQSLLIEPLQSASWARANVASKSTQSS